MAMPLHVHRGGCWFVQYSRRWPKSLGIFAILVFHICVEVAGLSVPNTSPSLAAGVGLDEEAEVNHAGASSVAAFVESNGAILGQHPRAGLMRKQLSPSSSRHFSTRPGPAQGRGVDFPSALTRVPARRKVQRPPTTRASTGPFLMPDMKTQKHPPWVQGSWTGVTARSSPTYEKSHMAFLKGGASLREASQAAANARRPRPQVETDKPKKRACNPARETCCNRKDPPAVYEACMQDMKNEDAGLADRMIPCDARCEKNCCCFFPTVAKGLIKSFAAAKSALMMITLKTAIQIQSVTNKLMGIVPVPENEVKEKDPEEERENASQLGKDIKKWVAGTFVGSYMLVRIHLLLGPVRRALAALLRSCFGSKGKLDGLLLDENDPYDPRTVEKFLTETEMERLGGVVRSFVAELHSVSAVTWNLAVFFSLGLFYWAFTIPTQMCIMVLGKSGRFLILNRKPLMPLSSAVRMFMGVGFTFTAVFIMVIIWLHSIERTLIQGAESPDPEIRAAAANNPMKSKIIGKVHIFSLGMWVLMWLGQLLIFVFTLRPKATNDGRDYYESSEASCAQYFRFGKRGLIPCSKKRRQKGTMKLFFGPYPEISVWQRMSQGQGFDGKFLDCLQPMMMLDADPGGNGSPAGGGAGDPSTSDSKVNTMQKILGGANWFLGTMGLCVFGLHCMNLAQNVDMCPESALVVKCVVGQDCTGYARTGWFQKYMERGGYLSQQMIMEASTNGDIKLAHIAMWLRLKTMKEAKVAAAMIAKKACMDRRSELIDGPSEDIRPKNADTLASFNSANYRTARLSMGIDVAWDDATLDCLQCPKATMVHHFSNFENVAEVTEVLILMITCYVSAVLVKQGLLKAVNSPIGDLSFESNPASGQMLDIDRAEKEALGMMAQVFSYRYSKQLPDHVKKIEEKIRFAKSKGMDETKFQDPFRIDNTAEVWGDYTLVDGRIFLVNQNLLGLVEGEEIVSAWTESPRLTTKQKLILAGGIIFLGIFPILYGGMVGQVKCMMEGVVAGGTHLLMFHHFVLKRRCQAGLIISTRRIFQVTRTPAYRDIFGKVEPLMKIDVLTHNSSIFYLSGMFQATVPMHRRIMAKCCNSKVYRAGGITVQSEEGILKLWRDRGDMRESIEAFSKVAMAEYSKKLSPQGGKTMMEEEDVQIENRPFDPCHPFILACCPFTPDAPYADADIIRRYAMRFGGEINVYGRQLSTRPASCKDIVCGKGCCRMACECCPCCMFDETLTEFMITTHRILVEQRVAMRYCRCCYCVRPRPNIRVTFLANEKASAYVFSKSCAPHGITALREDLTVKILPENCRTFPSGLELHQQPYRIVSGRNDGAELLWTNHVSKIFDALTEKEQDAKEEVAPPASEELPSSSSSASEGDDSGGDGESKKAKKKIGRAKGKARPKAKEAERATGKTRSGARAGV